MYLNDDRMKQDLPRHLIPTCLLSNSDDITCRIVVILQPITIDYSRIREIR